MGDAVIGSSRPWRDIASNGFRVFRETDAFYTRLLKSTGRRLDGLDAAWVRTQRSAMAIEPTDTNDTSFEVTIGASADGVRLVLHPPTPFSLSLQSGQYRLLLPYGAASVDVALLGDDHVRRALRPGLLLLAAPHEALSVRYVEPFEFLLVSFAPDRVRAAAERGSARSDWGAAAAPARPERAVAAIASEIRRTMIDEALPSPRYLAALTDALIVRLTAQDVNGTRDLGFPISPAAMARVGRHIDAHLDRPLDVAELAEVAGLSKAHFARAFAKAAGEPPLRFVMLRRVCRARDLVSGSDLSLAEIAARCGFASQAHMSTAFGRLIGVSPAKYRAAFRQAAA